MYERSYQKQILKEKKPVRDNKLKRRKIILLSVLFLVLVTGFVFVARAPGLQVKEINILGNEVTDSKELQDLSSNLLKGNFLFVIPKSNALFINQKKMEEVIKKEYPRLSLVEVKRNSAKAISINVSEYQEEFIWCQNKENLEDCFFMDKNGTVFSKAPFFSGSAYTRIFGGSTDYLPFNPVKSFFINKISEYKGGLALISIKPESFWIESESKMEVYFSYNNEETKIIVTPTDSVSNVIDNLGIALSTEPFKSEFESKDKKLDYIDARFANKIVYKFK